MSQSLAVAMTLHVYEIRQRDDKRGVDLISDALPFRADVDRENSRPFGLLAWCAEKFRNGK